MSDDKTMFIKRYYSQHKKTMDAAQLTLSRYLFLYTIVSVALFTTSFLRLFLHIPGNAYIPILNLFLSEALMDPYIHEYGIFVSSIVAVLLLFLVSNPLVSFLWGYVTLYSFASLFFIKIMVFIEFLDHFFSLFLFIAGAILPDTSVYAVWASVIMIIFCFLLLLDIYRTTKRLIENYVNN